jgi:hypothetical protein
MVNGLKKKSFEAWSHQYQINSQMIKTMGEFGTRFITTTLFSPIKKEVALFQKWLFTICDSKYLNFLKIKV